MTKNPHFINILNWNHHFDEDEERRLIKVNAICLFWPCFTSLFTWVLFIFNACFVNFYTYTINTLVHSLIVNKLLMLKYILLIFFIRLLNERQFDPLRTVNHSKYPTDFFMCTYCLDHQQMMTGMGGSLEEHVVSFLIYWNFAWVYWYMAGTPRWLFTVAYCW